MQYHPTTLYQAGFCSPKGVAERARTSSTRGRPLHGEYAPNAMELPHATSSRGPATEIDEGRGVNSSVLLDMRHLGAEDPHPAAGLARAVGDVCGVDPIYDPVPVRRRPLPHGRRGDRRRRDRAGELYAPPARCVSVHGSNRLGGNSLMETITFGRRAGRAAEFALAHNPAVVTAPSALDDARRDLVELLDERRRAAMEDPRELGSSMLETSASFGADQMVAQLGIIEGLRDRYEHVVVEDKGDIFNSDLTQALELAYLIAWPPS